MALFSLLNVVDSDAAETTKNLTFCHITHICRAREGRFERRFQLRKIHHYHASLDWRRKLRKRRGSVNRARGSRAPPPSAGRGQPAPRRSIRRIRRKRRKRIEI